ncbi:MAG: hypothetical protein R3E10_02925 [Gemmatimonadota bacterium]
MKAYLYTSGLLFALVVLAHGARLLAEGRWLLRDPVWLLLTALAAAMAVWAWRLVRSLQQR